MGLFSTFNMEISLLTWEKQREFSQDESKYFANHLAEAIVFARMFLI